MSTTLGAPSIKMHSADSVADGFGFFLWEHALNETIFLSQVGKILHCLIIRTCSWMVQNHSGAVELDSGWIYQTYPVVGPRLWAACFLLVKNLQPFLLSADTRGTWILEQVPGLICRQSILKSNFLANFCIGTRYL